MAHTATEHTTLAGDIEFMALARAFKDPKTGKEMFSIKIKLDSTDPAVAHLAEVADYKVDTKTNRSLKDTGKTVVNFSTSYAPIVMDAEGTEMAAEDIPFFDSRKDAGRAAVVYKVIDMEGKKIVRLSGVKLLELELAPREEFEGSSVKATLEALKDIKA